MSKPIDLSAFIANLGTSASPEVQKAVATAQQLEADIKAALPSIAVMVANGVLQGVPGGAILEGFLDPAIKEGATLAEDYMWGLLDHALANPQVLPQTTGA